MFRFVCLCAIVLAVQAQRYVDDPRVAAILSEQRYLSGDGTFGAAYTQEDGVDFKEESDAAGNRRGSYSYVDPSGQRRTITYTAGKNGFQASGDHLPVAPAAPPQPVPQAGYKPQPQYNPAPQPQYNPAPQTFSNAIPNEDDGQYYPELYEKESQSNYVAPQPQYKPAPAPQPQYNPAPQQRYSGVQQPAYVAPQQQYSGVQSSQYSGVQTASPRPAYNPEPTQPARIFPPGKLDLNRSPDGFAYQFSSKY